MRRFEREVVNRLNRIKIKYAEIGKLEAKQPAAKRSGLFGMTIVLQTQRTAKAW